MDAKEIIKEVAEKIQTNANVRAVFGDPYEKGEFTVIPVSRVKICGCGCGSPGEPRGKDENEENNKEGKKGRGMGIGFHVKTIPVGYIEIGKEGARYVEVTDQTRIFMAGIGLGAFAFFFLTRLLVKLFKK
jgi:uncharacterized spore protein YtfJ